MLSAQIRKMIANGQATVGPPVRVEIPKLRKTGISPETQALDLELPPSTNNLFFNGKGKQGGRIKTPEYKEWIAVHVPILAALKPVRILPFSIEFTLYGGEGLNPARDLGNLEKPITDALVTACIIPGDSITAGLWGLSLTYRPSDEGRTFVRVRVREKGAPET